MSAKIKILVVEDDVPSAEMVKILLARADCEVLIAHTGHDGMELAQREKFDLIALDIDLPDINGLKICHELKQRHFSRYTPIIFMSGRPLEEDIQRGLEIGAVDYITKPFGASDFVRRILNHVKTGNGFAGTTQSAIA
jgi:two-component system alkaline phosphatase synthesis response regulator PhoP